jgi:hypothetical protein
MLKSIGDGSGGMQRQMARCAKSHHTRLAFPGRRRTQSIGVLVPKGDVVVDEVTVACTSGRPFGTLPNVDQANSERRSVSQ